MLAPSGYSPCPFFSSLLDRLSGIEFEQWLINSIRQAGILNVLPTKRTGDQGADIIVRHGGKTVVIQAKYYQQPVGNGAVQEVHTAKSHYGANEAWVVTNSTFTRAARELATTAGVRLVDRSGFKDIGSLVAQVLTASELPASAHHSSRKRRTS